VIDDHYDGNRHHGPVMVSGFEGNTIDDDEDSEIDVEGSETSFAVRMFSASYRTDK
jgi:hypothetical protein